MKITIIGHELVDPEVQAVSLVKRGANRAPFKILKSDQQIQPAAHVIHEQPYDNQHVDQRYPLGRPTPAKNSLDALVAHAWALKNSRRR